jgi:hypothetical protein
MKAKRGRVLDFAAKQGRCFGGKKQRRVSSFNGSIVGDGLVGCVRPDVEESCNVRLDEDYC